MATFGVGYASAIAGVAERPGTQADGDGELKSMDKTIGRFGYYNTIRNP